MILCPKLTSALKKTMFIPAVSPLNWVHDCIYTLYRCMWLCLCNRLRMERWWWRASWTSPGEWGDPSGWRYRMTNRCFPLPPWPHRTPSVQSAYSQTRGSFHFLKNIMLLISLVYTWAFTSAIVTQSPSHCVSCVYDWRTGEKKKKKTVLPGQSKSQVNVLFCNTD